LQSISVITAAIIYAVTYFPTTDGPPDFPYGIGNPYRQIICADGTQSRHLSALDAAAAAAVSGAVTSATTELLKKQAVRQRPDTSDNLSFPSGHATAAAWANRYSARMIQYYDVPPQYAYPAYGALALLTVGTAWGRVEAARHYPGDVLAGIFIGAALTDAAFAVFDDGGGQAGNTKINILFTNERAGKTTGLSMTVDF
jgi:membrane-associated phospholipid phosphatase